MMPGASPPTRPWPTAITRSRPSPSIPPDITISSTTTIVPDLVIDTVGPKVTSVNFNRLQGQIQVTFQDFGGVNNAGVGLNVATVIDANNYQLTTVHHPRVGKYRVNIISDVTRHDHRHPDRHPIDQWGQVHQRRLVLLHDPFGQPDAT